MTERLDDQQRTDKPSDGPGLLATKADMDRLTHYMDRLNDAVMGVPQIAGGRQVLETAWDDLHSFLAATYLRAPRSAGTRIAEPVAWMYYLHGGTRGEGPTFTANADDPFVREGRAEPLFARSASALPGANKVVCQFCNPLLNPNAHGAAPQVANGEPIVPARTSITDREPSGYVAILDDKTSSQHGGWFIGAYHSQQSAMMALAGQKSGGRTVPFYFATDDELSSMMAKAMCAHEWVRARNQAVASGEICLKCFAVRAEENATDAVPDRNIDRG